MPMSNHTYIVGRRKDGAEEHVLTQEQLRNVVQGRAARRKSCPFCYHNDNDFRTLNAETAQYSFLQIAMNCQGMLRVRDLSPGGGQEVIHIHYCPMCGEKL